MDKLIKLKWKGKPNIKIRHNNPAISLNITNENKDNLEVTKEQSEVLLRNPDFEKKGGKE